jgi:transposase
VRNVDDLRSLLGTSAFVYVADSKLCTVGNLAHLRAYGGEFVTILPRTRKEDRDFRRQLRAGTPSVRWRKFHSVPNARRTGEPPDVYSGTDAGPQATSDGHRLIWVRSSQKAAVDAQAREDRIRRAEIELREMAAKVGARQLRTRPAVERRAEEILASHKAADFLKISVHATTEISHRYLRAGRPRPGDAVRQVKSTRLTLHVARNREAIHAEQRTDGVFPLVTSLTGASKREALEIYKYQPQIEKRFALTKSEYGIAPIFLKKPRRVVALLHVYFVAIMLSALLERQVRGAMKVRGLKGISVLPENRPSPTPTTPRILERFADVAWHEFNEGERRINFPVLLDANLKLLIDLADVPPTLYS